LQVSVGARQNGTENLRRLRWRRRCEQDWRLGCLPQEANPCEVRVKCAACIHENDIRSSPRNPGERLLVGTEAAQALEAWRRINAPVPRAFAVLVVVHDGHTDADLTGGARILS
jgi:hypothetical protein